jgi:transposase
LAPVPADNRRQAEGSSALATAAAVPATDFDGLPLSFHLTGGQASDSRNFETLLDLGPDITPRTSRPGHHAPDITPRTVIGDKSYDGKGNRKAARRRGICPVIPYRRNAIAKPKFFPRALYKARARIEQTIGKLKRFKRIALRCEKTAQNFAAFISLACTFIWAKSVHTA